MTLKDFFLLMIVLISAPLGAQDKTPPSPPKKLTTSPISFFEYIVLDSISEITMIGDFQTIRRNKYREDYYSGHLNFMDKDSVLHTFPVSYRTRGKSRKKLCFHPALKLKFPKKELKARGLNTDNKYKLVCQCSYGRAHRQSLFREFLAYKMYNLISPYSFQVHLMEINYIETSRIKKDKRYGFLLESEKTLEKRLGGQMIDRDELSLDKISRTESIRMSIFQYMIANTDWNVTALHNVKLLLDKNESIIPIPYDYDYSGLAKTPYSSANPDYPVKTVTDRYFISVNYTAAEINEQLIYFHQQKEAIHNLLINFSLLSRRSKRFVVRFINNFYKTIEDEQKVIQELVR